MIKILFICLGNICRSPMAEFVMKELVVREGRADEFVIASAATSTEEIGNGIHRGTRRILQQNGIYCEGHRAVQMTRADYEKYDYLIGMDEANIRNMLRIVGEDREKKIYKLLDFTGSPRAIADPWYTGDFETTYADVREGCEAFYAYLAKKEGWI